MAFPSGALVLVGHFDSAVALERLKLWFADVPDAGPAPARFSATPAQSTPQRGVIEDKVEDRTIYLAWPTVELKHADMPALDLLSWVLSKGRGTRLDDALYYDKPLADSEGAWTFNGAAGGMFVVEATSVRTPLTKLEAAARKVIAGLITTPPTADELLRAKKALRQYYEDQLQDPVSAAELLADCAFEWGDPNCAAARVAAYEAVTPNDLVRVTQTWLLSREPHRLSVVPQGDTGAIAGSSPVEIP
jgi:zinc protease